MQRQGKSARPTGFTLIELLTVISIIAILMAIGVGTASVASRKMKESRVKTQLASLQTAIESYKAERGGAYPPDNPTDPAVNQLFYELTGTLTTDSGATYRSLARGATDAGTIIPSGTLSSTFHVPGFANSSADRTQVRNYLPNLKADMHKPISGSPEIRLLIVGGVEWPTRKPPAPAPLARYSQRPEVLRLIPWQYVSTSPTNNPSSYDLWANIVIGNEVRTFSNWKQ
jgi:prepilin-type N-terminal cleavage/methylation domain-containing protein